MRCSFVLVFLLLWALPASATTYYVDDTGSGINCTQAQVISTPHNTIAEGLACLSAGDTLYIRAGSYAETITAASVADGTSWVNPITVSAYQGETVTLNPSGTPFAVLNFGTTIQYVIFDGLTLDMSNVTLGNNGNGIHLNDGAGPIRFQNGVIYNSVRECVLIQSDAASGSEFINNDVSECGIECVSDATCRTTHCNAGYCGHGFYVIADDTLIKGNHVHDVSGFGVHIYGGGWAGSTDGTIVDGNRIHGNGRAVDFGGAAFGCGILASGSDDGSVGTVIKNNLVYDNHSCGISLELETQNDVLILNNTVYSNDNSVCIKIASSSTDAVVGNNICQGNAGGAEITNSGTNTTFATNLCDGAGTGCITGTIGLSDPANGDFTLDVSSDAINAGTDYSSDGVTEDFAGVSRPQSAAFDIGAYEYVAEAGGGSGPGSAGAVRLR